MEDQYEETQPYLSGFFGDIKDNNACSVRVALRVRPFVGRELREGTRKKCVTVDDLENKIMMADKNFSFDKVFAEEEYQETIFDICSKNLILGCFAGYNATILAYGQTGSGKTHTMGTGSTIGLSEDQVGIVPRVFDFIFSELENRKKSPEFTDFTIKVQFLELYNEELHDLLEPGPMDPHTGQYIKTISIREEKNGQIKLEGLQEMVVKDTEECMKFLNLGISHRITSSTLMNEGSSRSHAIFTICIEQKIVRQTDQSAVDQKNLQPGESMPESTEETIEAKFHFVDLAGSERIKKTGAVGKVLKEGININKGLLALGNVISALTETSKNKNHVPYRDSKLTRILQDSLGGNSRTTMIACCSPADSNADETFSTIQYASRARNIKNKPVINRDPNAVLIESLKGQITQLQGEVIEFVAILKQNNLEIPANLSESVAEKQQQQQQQKQAPILKIQPQSSSGNESQPQQSVGSQNEINTLKIKLSKKDREIKELQEKLKSSSDKKSTGDAEFSKIESERNALRIKNEELQALLKTNNISFQTNESSSSDSGAATKLVDEYKAKINTLKSQMEKVDQAKSESERNFQKLQKETSSKEQLLKKHMEENSRLKRQIKKLEEDNKKINENSSAEPKKLSKFQQFRQQEKERKEKEANMLKEFNQNFLAKIQTHLTIATMNTQGGDDEAGEQQDSIPEQDQKKETTEQDSSSQQPSQSVEDKEKMILAVKQGMNQMEDDLKKMMENELSQKIKDLEAEVKQAENEKQKQIQKSKDDAAVQQVQKEFQKKMDALNKELQTSKKEKQKQEAEVVKQIKLQENKISSLQKDVDNVKKQKEQIELQKKYDIDRFDKFKKEKEQEMNAAKKESVDKEKLVAKLKNDLKKTDQVAQQKIQELKALQKKAMEQKQRRMEEEKKADVKMGVDKELIKEWVTMNAQQMVQHQELKKLIQKQKDDEQQVEDEMLEEGDRLAELMMQQEMKEIELGEENENETKDEGKILELEQELDDILQEINSITETLDSLDETLQFIQKKTQEYEDEVRDLDIENSIKNLEFHGMQNLQSAKQTLKTFFDLLLETTVEYRDLEKQSLDQDEKMIELKNQVKILQIKCDNMAGKGYSENAIRIAREQKEKAIKNIVSQMDSDFLDNRATESLQLSVTENRDLTKLSLSKIVNNLRQKLKDEERKNQNVTLKLEQALKDKDKYKDHSNNLEKQIKNQSLGQGSSYRSSQANRSSLPASQSQSQINTQQSSQSEGSSGSSKRGFISATTLKRMQKQQNAQTSGTSSAPVKKHMSFQERRLLQKQEQEQRNKQAAQNLESIQEEANVASPSKKQVQQPVRVPNLADKRAQMKGRSGAGGQHAGDHSQASSGLNDLDKLKKQSAENRDSSSSIERSKERAKQLHSKMKNVQQQQQVKNDQFEDLGIPKIDEVADYDDEDDELFNNLDKKNQDSKNQQDHSTSQIQSSQNSISMIDNDGNTQSQYDWMKEDLINLKLDGLRLIDFDSVGGKIYMLFEDLSIKICDLEKKEIIKEFNLQEVEDTEELEGEDAYAMAIEKDLNMMAVATSINVYLFDFSDGFSKLNKYDAENVFWIGFFGYHIVTMQDMGEDEIILTTYSMDNNQPLKTQVIKQFLGQQVLLRQADDALIYATGTQLGKMQVPDLNLIFQKNSKHTKPIIDLSLDQNYIFTTSEDSSLRGFDINTGNPICEAEEDLECDKCATMQGHCLARVGEGMAIIVFKYDADEKCMEAIDEIEMDEQEIGNSEEFRMRGGIKAELNGEPHNLLVMVNSTEASINFSVLKKKQLL